MRPATVSVVRAFGTARPPLRVPTALGDVLGKEGASLNVSVDKRFYGRYLVETGAFPAQSISCLKADALGIGWTTACLKSMSPYAIKASLSDRQ